VIHFFRRRDRDSGDEADDDELDDDESSDEDGDDDLEDDDDEEEDDDLEDGDADDGDDDDDDQGAFADDGALDDEEQLDDEAAVDDEDAAEQAPPGVVERPGGLLSKVAGNLVMYHDARSLHSEQYRTCRTNLTALNRAGGPWAVVVTSSRKGEGKSVTTANLAACLAELPGQRVCLIDADFRSPAQGPIFGVPNVPGLVELIMDEAPLKQVLGRTVVANLDLLPAGREPLSPAELLGGERFGNLLGELKRRYTWILIDTPPVNPYTDACVLAARCNGALLVVRMEQTARDQTQRAMASIKAAGGRVLGTFLTGLDTDREDGDRYGYYRADSGDKEVAKQEAARVRARRQAERRLRRQERAYLRDKRRRERKAEEPEI
jgi:capsular exopolysaccharide synthesis family protein